MEFPVDVTLESVCFISNFSLITLRAIYGDMSANTEALYEIATVL